MRLELPQTFTGSEALLLDPRRINRLRFLPLAKIRGIGGDTPREESMINPLSNPMFITTKLHQHHIRANEGVGLAQLSSG